MRKSTLILRKVSQVFILFLSGFIRQEKICFSLKLKSAYCLLYIYLNEPYHDDYVVCSVLNNFLQFVQLKKIINLKCVLIEFPIANLSMNYFCISDIFKNRHLNQVLNKE